jgi:hypothetical protein
MKRYVVASVLALSLAGFTTVARAQGGDESMNRLLESLQQVRTQMYTMAQSDRSMMAGVRYLDRTITMVKKHMAGSKRRTR